MSFFCRAISFVCQWCQGELHLLDPRPDPYGTWYCLTCKRVLRYGPGGWSELEGDCAPHDPRRVLQSPGGR